MRLECGCDVDINGEYWEMCKEHAYPCSSAASCSTRRYVQERQDKCGVLLRYGGNDYGYERHDARQLLKELSDIVKQWDA